MCVDIIWKFIIDIYCYYKCQTSPEQMQTKKVFTERPGLDLCQDTIHLVARCSLVGLKSP